MSIDLNKLLQIYEIDRNLYQPGIYFLYDKNELVYIGQSDFPPARISSHVKDGKCFDKVFFTPVSKQDLNYFESLLINHFKPRDNVHIVENLSRGYKHKSPDLLRKYFETDQPLQSLVTKRKVEGDIGGEYVSLSRASEILGIYPHEFAMMSKKVEGFPRPCKIGGVWRWKTDELSEWMNRL